MQYALDEDGERIEATRGVAAKCPNCHERVVARLGKVVAPALGAQGEEGLRSLVGARDALAPRLERPLPEGAGGGCDGSAPR